MKLILRRLHKNLIELNREYLGYAIANNDDDYCIAFNAMIKTVERLQKETGGD